MKQPKKLTRNQKEILSKKGYDWTKYMFDSEDTMCMYFVEKTTNETVALIKEGYLRCYLAEYSLDL